MLNNERKLNILHLTQTMLLGGAEMTILQYIKALGTSDYSHHLYCFGSDGPMRAKIAAAGAKVTIGRKRSTIKKPIDFLFSLKRLVDDLKLFIESNNIGVIHSHLPNANQLAVLVGKLTKTPVFVTIHSTMELEDGRSAFDPRVHLMRLVTRLTYRRADRIIAISEEVKEIICEKLNIPEKRMLIVKNGIIFHEPIPVDLDRFFETSFEGQLNIIAVGRLVQLKGFDTLIRAVHEVLHDLEIRLLIVGEGVELENLTSLISELELVESVKLLGLRDDVLALMKSSDIFVIPSHYEGLSLAMIEAMASGLAIIASDAPGLNRYVSNSNNGFLFPVGDYKALADHIRLLSGDQSLRKNLALASRRTFQREYDLTRNIDKLKGLYGQYF